MMICKWCGCELSEPEELCEGCKEALDATYSDQVESSWPEYISPREGA